MRVNHCSLLATNSQLQLCETLVRLFKTVLFLSLLSTCLHYLHITCVTCKRILYATVVLCFLSTIQVNNSEKTALFDQLDLFSSYSRHSSPRRHTQWLHPARVQTAAPTTVAVVTVALQVGTSSAKPTSTSEACPPQPQTMTWSSSVSREYHASSPHYLILITN